MALPRSIHTRPLIHCFFPVFQCPFKGIVDKRIQLVWIRLDEAQVENGVGIRFTVVFSLALSVLATKFPLIVLDIFQGLLEVVLTALSVVALLFDKFKGSQPEATVFIGLSKETNGLALRAQPAYSIFI